jgi:hypothetical protein
VLERINNILKRVQIYTDSNQPTPVMTEFVTALMVEVTSVFALADKQVAQGKWSKSLFTDKSS